MFVFCQERLCYKLIRSNYESRIYESCVRQVSLLIQLNLVIRNVLIRNKLVLRNHFPWPNANLLHKDKELLALRNNFRVTKKFLITKFDCIIEEPYFFTSIFSFFSVEKIKTNIMYIIQSTLVIRNFLVTLKLFLSAKSSLSLWSKLAFGSLTPICSLSKCSLSPRLTYI